MSSSLSPQRPVTWRRIVLASLLCALTVLVCDWATRAVALANDPGAFSVEESQGLQFGLGLTLMAGDAAALALQVFWCVLMRIGLMWSLAVVVTVSAAGMALGPTIFGFGL